MATSFDDLIRQVIGALEKIAKSLEEFKELGSKTGNAEAKAVDAQKEKEKKSGKNKDFKFGDIPVIGDMYNSLKSGIHGQITTVTNDLTNQLLTTTGIKGAISSTLDPRNQIEEIAGIYAKQGVPLGQKQLESMYSMLRSSSGQRRGAERGARKMTGGAGGTADELGEKLIQEAYDLVPESWANAPSNIIQTVMKPAIAVKNYFDESQAESRRQKMLQGMVEHQKKVSGNPTTTGQ
jgi:hypothetical protein